MQLSQSFFFRLITKIVLISYLHAVFYPIYADETLDRQAELAKRKAAYSIKIETLGSEDGAGIQTDGQESPQAPRAIRLMIKDRRHLQDKRAALEGDQKDSSSSTTSKRVLDPQNPADTDVIPQVFTITSENLSRYRDMTETYDKVTGLSKGISWDLDGYHRLFIGWDGASTLQGGLDDDDQTVSSSTGLAFEKSPPITIESLKIKTEHTVAVKNALAKFLKVSNQSAVVVKGETHIEAFDVKSKPRSGTESGLYIDGDSQLKTKTLRMLAGKLTNYGRLDLAEGATVTFSNDAENDLINHGTITGSGKASFQKVGRATNTTTGLIDLPQLTLDTQELTQQGTVKGQEVTLNVTERLTNTGKVTADDTLALNLSDRVEVRNTGTMKGDKATVKGSGTLENLGIFNFKTIDAARTAITQRGLLKATDSLTLRDATLSNLGATQAKEVDLKGSSTLINGDLETKGAQLSVSAQLSMEEQSHLINHGKASIEKITGEGTALLNDGELEVKDIDARITNFTNREQMTVRGHLNLQDSILENDGTLTVKNITMQRGKLHNKQTGDITVQDAGTFTLSSFVNDGDWTSEKGFRLTLTDAGDQKGTLRQNGTMSFNGDSQITGHLFHNTKKFVAKGKLILDLYDLLNTTRGEFYAKDVSVVPQNITSSGKMHLDGVKGDQTIQRLSVRKATTQAGQAARASEFTIENPENLIIQKVDVAQDSKLLLKKGKVDVKSLVTKEGSTTKVSSDTHASFTGTFYNQGAFASDSPLYFDWEESPKNKGKLFYPGEMHFSETVTFNLRGGEDDYATTGLLAFLRNPKIHFGPRVNILAHHCIIDDHLTFPAILSLDLTGRFAILNALLKVKGLHVEARDTIHFSKPESAYRDIIIKDKYGRETAKQREIVLEKPKSEIESEEGFTLKGRHVDAKWLFGRAGSDIRLQALEKLEIGEGVIETSWDKYGHLVEFKSSNQAYLYSLGKIILEARYMQLDFSHIKALGGCDLISSHPILAFAVQLLSGGATNIKTPKFSFQLGFDLSQLSRRDPAFVRYVSVEIEKRIKALRPLLYSLGALKFEGSEFQNESGFIAALAFLTEKNDFKEISYQPFKDKFGRMVLSDTIYPTTQTAHDFHLQNMTGVSLSGNHSAGRAIDIDSKGDLSNINKSHHRTTKDITDPQTLNITEFIQKQADITRIHHSDGHVSPLLPAKYLYTDLNDALPFLGKQPPKNMMDPLSQLDIRDVGLSCMAAIFETTGLQLTLEYLITNARNLKKKEITADDLKDLKASIAYFKAIKRANGTYERQFYLHIVPGDQNPYQSCGDMYSNGSLKAISKGDQTHQSNRLVARKSLTAQSTEGKMKRITTKYATYQSDSKNFSMQEHADPTQTMASLEEDVTATSREEYFEEGVDTLAALDLKRGSTHAKTTSKHLELMSYSSSSSKRRSESITNYSHKPSQAIAGQDSSTNAGKGTSLNIIGSTTHADRDNTLEVEDGVINVEAAASVNEHKSSSTKSSAFGSISSSSTQQSAVITPAGFSAGRKGKLSADKANVTGGHIKVKVLDNATKKGITAQPKVVDTVSTTESSGKGSLGSFHASSTTFKQYGTDTIIEAEQIITPNSKITITAINPDQFWGERGKPEIIGEIGEIQKYILKEWKTSTASYSGIYDPKIGAVISIAITVAISFATGGTGSWASAGNISAAFAKQGVNAIAAKMIGAGVNHAIVNLASNAVMEMAKGGNPMDAAKALISKKGLRGVAMAAINAGVLNAAGLDVDVPREASLPQVIQQEVQKAVIKTGVDVVVGGEKLSDALKANLLNAAGRVGARQIGKAYGAKDLTSFEHKALHAALGGAIGALSSDNPAKGALSGAVAGALAEIIADLITTKPEEAIQQALNDSSNPNALRDFLQNYEDHVGLTTDIAQVLTAAIAAALNLDIQVANNVANNAVKNNMLPMMVMLAEAGGAAASAAALHYMRQVFLTAGAAGLSYLISKMPEEQRISLTALWNKYATSMDAAPEIDTQDKGFTPHENIPQALVTPVPDRLPILHITPIPENHPIEQEGYGIYDGPQMNILYNDLKKIAESVGAFSLSGQIKDAQLPSKGKIRFIPPKNHNPSQPLRKGPNNGYIDNFANEWVKGPSRTDGQPFEWDVQLSRTGQSKLGWLSRDKKHVNVSLDGKVTHK